MAGVWAGLRCFFGHKWRWYYRGAPCDVCVNCDKLRIHVPGTRLRNLSAMALVLAVSVFACPPPVFAQTDAIDLSHATIVDAPPDISAWPATTSISAVREDPTAGISLDFAAKDTWPDYAVPGWNGGTVQYTVWLCVQVPDWTCSAFVQMWKGRSDTDGSIPAILSGYKNYAYASRWGAMYGYVPKVGDSVGILVSAGNARDTAMVTSVRERSNVVVFQLPAGDTGAWGFEASSPAPMPVPVPVFPPAPSPAPTPTPTPDVSALQAALTALQAQVNAATTDIATLAGRVQSVESRVTTLESRTIPVSCSASVFGVPIHCALQ